MIFKFRTPGNIAILTLAMLFALSGCSVMIAKSGISGLGEIPGGLSRKEVQERFGSPASSSTTSAGKQIEIYNIRKQLDCVVWLMGTNSSACSPRRVAEQELGWCAILAPICFGTEFFNAPINLVRSEMNKIQVAFVYGADDRVLYSYEPKAEPSSRYDQALHTLTHPLSSGTELAKCPSAKKCMEGYVEELQRRAAEVGYTLSKEDEDDAIGRDLEMARNVDDGKITKQEAVFYAAISSLEVSSLKWIALGQCPSVADCVAGDTEVFRRRAAELNYSPTTRDEEFFRLELELGKDVDAGKITKEEMIRRTWLNLAKLRGH